MILRPLRLDALSNKYIYKHNVNILRLTSNRERSAFSQGIGRKSEILIYKVLAIDYLVDRWFFGSRRYIFWMTIICNVPLSLGLVRLLFFSPKLGYILGLLPLDSYLSDARFTRRKQMYSE